MWCAWLLVICSVLITTAAVVPHGSEVETITVVSIGLDKIIHFIGFGCMAVLALGASKGLAFWKRTSLVVLVILFGIVIECIQYYLPIGHLILWIFLPMFAGWELGWWCGI